MNTPSEIHRIYTDNNPQRIAVCGLTSQLGRFFRRHNLPMSRQIIERHCGEFRSEQGASFASRTRALIHALASIGRPDRAEMLANSFQILPPEQRKMRLSDWVNKWFAHSADLNVLTFSGDGEKLRLKCFEIIALMRACPV